MRCLLNFNDLKITYQQRQDYYEISNYKEGNRNYMKLFSMLRRCIFVVFLFYCNIASAQTPDIVKEIEELKQGQQAIQKKLQDIESLLEKIATQPPMRPAPPSGPVIKAVSIHIRMSGIIR